MICLLPKFQYSEGIFKSNHQAEIIVECLMLCLPGMLLVCRCSSYCAVTFDLAHIQIHFNWIIYNCNSNGAQRRGMKIKTNPKILRTDCGSEYGWFSEISIPIKWRTSTITSKSLECFYVNIEPFKWIQEI